MSIDLLYEHLFAVYNVYSLLWSTQSLAGNVVYIIVFVLWGRGYLPDSGGVAETYG